MGPGEAAATVCCTSLYWQAAISRTRVRTAMSDGVERHRDPEPAFPGDEAMRRNLSVHGKGRVR
jgi:hypothetical protein